MKRFVDRTIKRAYDSFENEYSQGQNNKKRAVIQLIDTTMGGQKKFYHRWINITQKTKLIKECKEIGNVFNSLNKIIKSTNDNAFGNNRDRIGDS